MQQTHSSVCVKAILSTPTVGTLDTPCKPLSHLSLFSCSWNGGCSSTKSGFCTGPLYSIISTDTHKYLLSGDSQPVCDECQCSLTVKHILLECCSLKHVRENYFTCSSFKELFENVDGSVASAGDCSYSEDESISHAKMVVWWSMQTVVLTSVYKWHYWIQYIWKCFKVLEYCSEFKWWWASQFCLHLSCCRSFAVGASLYPSNTMWHLCT